MPVPLPIKLVGAMGETMYSASAFFGVTMTEMAREYGAKVVAGYATLAASGIGVLGEGSSTVEHIASGNYLQAIGSGLITGASALIARGGIRFIRGEHKKNHNQA